ncbi:MAG: D-alanine--D-alanine ligase [Candidatus Pseudothioglobus sp.]|jgi:D-alanine-D-alanine ligase|nr:D-alanine--D-alanine ligase [Candidatus Thioglobus sp.]OUW83603.1 MAG: D-alanine--D-alanine ligase [Candidatus Thioglobus sp. TMED218]|tara:strand:+ start:130 stop:1008 length:879 start_codon:yes stop_codon:yes gene_type:complete
MIAVLMGGYSAEREISLLSGNAVYQALIDSKIDCFSFDLNDKNLDELWKMKFNKAFIVLHGRGGEDGFIQSELNKKNIPFTGSNAKSSALCMDKAITKDLWKKHSLPISESIVVTKGDTLESISFPLPWAVKPTLEGSSIGITQVKNESELDSALEEAFKYGNQALVEQWIDGDEYTVSILNNNALPSIKITSDHDIYDYHSKYFSSKTQYLCPSDLTSQQELNLQNIALEAFNLTGASGWGRVDFILDKDRNPFLLEINTVPGMTSHSLVPMAAKASNMSFNDLVIKILNG